ncbi:MAG: DUF2752 domain-containing protein [Planctomycetota bacterium]
MSSSIIQRIFRRGMCAFAAAYLLFVVIQPAAGFEAIQICIMRRFAGVPCPTCGLTRSMTNLIHLQPVEAAIWHPLGFITLPVLFFMTSMLFLTNAKYDALAAALFRKQRFIFTITAWLAALTFVYGIVRAIGVSSGYYKFPV